jgi:hypothetical protein
MELTARRDPGSPGRCTQHDDVYVKGLRRFILRYENYSPEQRHRLGWENPGLYIAYQLYNRRNTDSQYLTRMVEARILARQSDADIAKEHTLHPEAVSWYHALYFDVRPRLKSLDWIINHVLFPAYSADMPGDAQQAERQRNNQTPLPRPISLPMFDCTSKFFAYFGGHLLLDFILTGFQRESRVTIREQCTDYLDAQTQSRIIQRSAESAQTFAVTQDNVMALFAVHQRISDSRRQSRQQIGARDGLMLNIQTMLEQLPFAVGDAGALQAKGTALEKYDAGAAELSSDEMLKVMSGPAPVTIEGVDLLTLPQPSSGEPMIVEAENPNP